MTNCPVIDADGHVLEKERYIRKYLEPHATTANYFKGDSL